MIKKITKYGAKNDGSNCATAIQSCIDDVAAQGGGTVVVPAGEFMSGPFLIKSKINLHLEAGAVLKASGNYDEYPPELFIDQITNGVVDEYVLPKRAWIMAYQAKSIQITGPGTIDGNADAFIEKRGEDIHSMRAPIGGRSQYLERPFTIFLIDCPSVELRDFTIDNPAFWALRLSGCDNANIYGIRIMTDMKVPNADGIDIDRCENVVISNCHFETADDCISVKSCSGTSIYGLTRNIIIEKCFFRTASGAITLGTESAGDIENVFLSDCQVVDSHRGFAVRAREGGVIKNVVFKDSTLETHAYGPDWWGHGEALHVTAASWDHPDGTTDGNPERLLEGTVENITFENLKVRTEGSLLVWAQRLGLIKQIAFKNIDLTMASAEQWPPRTDLRPNGYQDFIKEPHHSIALVNCEDISITDSKIHFASENPRFFNKSKLIENVKNFEEHNLTIQ